MQTRGVVGKLAYALFRLQLARTTLRFLSDLAHDAESGRPSPPTQRQLTVAAATPRR